MAPTDLTLSTIRLDEHRSPGGAPILVCTIDNPASAYNAVDASLHADFATLFAWLRRTTHARAIVLTGSKKAFCAGGDFAWFEELRTIEALEHLRHDAKAIINDLLDIEVPVVAAINGPAVGLGASIALLTDAAIMASNATIADPHVRVGIVAGDGGTTVWPLVLGPMLAKRYLLTGDPVTADDALRLGLVTHVVAPEAVFEEALAFAGRLADGAPLALRGTKAAVNKLIKDALNVSFDSATNAEIVTLLSHDHAEALAARAERREPRFTGS
jgi:enoyl-CoA hydratase